ncbi:MAG: glutamate 5-kinase [Chthoniobacterales bacterium]|jgi:glutamate 5-kinase|nr:glutamate 5-kinase [Chthoniobacterales bacterium]
MKKRIVLKFGTGILTTDAVGLQLDRAQFRRLAAEISALIEDGHAIVIISSAAVAAGVAALGRRERPSSLPAKQACAAVGQSQLMRAYEESFAEHHLTAAQLLLTHEDIDSGQRRTNAENTLRELLSYPRVVPVINENDSVAVEELGFGDNDQLGAEVASLCRADLYLILTRSDGLQAEGRRLPTVTDLAGARGHVTGEKGEHSTGGMGSKLDAVEFATRAGIETWILDGMQPGRIAAALAGMDTGTRFPPTR